MEPYVYLLTVLADGVCGIEGQSRIEFPFEPDAETVLEEALAAVGIFNPRGYSIEEAEPDGWLIRDPYEDPYLTLALDTDTGEPEFTDGEVAVHEALDEYYPPEAM